MNIYLNQYYFILIKKINQLKDESKHNKTEYEKSIEKLNKTIKYTILYYLKFNFY